MFDIMNFYLELGVDGFRLDVANYYLKDTELKSNPFAFTTPNFMFQNHIYDRNLPETLEIF
jgi:alpha-glucosidase